MNPARILLLLCVFCTLVAEGKPIRLRVHSDLPYFSRDNKFVQDIYYEIDTTVEVKLNVRFLDINKHGDSTILYKTEVKGKNLKKGTEKLQIYLDRGTKTFCDQSFRQVMKEAKYMPAGQYCLQIRISTKDTTFQFYSLKYSDSLLNPDSYIKKGIDECFLGQKRKSILGMKFLLPTTNVADNINVRGLNTQSKLNKFFRKHKLSYMNAKRSDKDLLDVYKRDRYLGSYEVDTSAALSKKIVNDRKKLSENIPGVLKLDVEHTQSLFSQVKDITREKKEHDEVIGNLNIRGVGSSGQEELSENENNYYEVAGDLEVPILNIPVTLQGYYTSQDRNRTVKSSYWRIHYDNEKAKEKLQKLLGGYKDKHSQVKSKVGGAEGAYQIFISQLQSQMESLKDDIIKQTGVIDVNGESLNDPKVKKGLQDKIAAAADSGSKGNTTKVLDTANKAYDEILAKYQKIQELEEKSNKYIKLLEQYRNTMHFDSALVLNKVKELAKDDDISYKKLAKKASGILPEGQSNKLITGLTNLDIGVFSKDLSNYTMAGQTMKGIDLGYELGIFEVGATLGKAEYVSRTGQLDKYTSYSGRVITSPVKDHKLSLFYYGYTPDRRMLNEDAFYKNVDVAMPSFRRNVHIVSAKYDMQLKKDLKASGEIATSFRNGDEFEQAQDQKLNDKLAYNVNVNYSIPKTTIAVNGSYRHAGKSFENNSTPMSFSGTDHYIIGAEGIFLRSKLTLGGDYNYLEQRGLTYTGGNTKWGVNIKYAPGKRYPSVSFSYKPFSTFRSFSDTFNIPQRPMMGVIATGRVTYTIKKKSYSVRFNGIYTENSTEMDTSNYSSKLMQFNCMLTKGSLSVMANVGSSKMKGDNIAPQHANTTFGGLSISSSLGKLFFTSVGQEVGFTKIGFSRYSVVGSVGYRPAKQKVSVSLCLRYNNYKNPEIEPWKKVYGATLDVNWQFKMKVTDKKDQ